MRYHTASGSAPKLEASFFLQGPQDESQVADDIKNLLDRPGILSVAIFYDHGLGTRVDVVRKIPEEKKDG